MLRNAVFLTVIKRLFFRVTKNRCSGLYYEYCLIDVGRILTRLTVITTAMVYAIVQRHESKLLIVDPCALMEL
jgi:hypothetical protein